MGTQRLGSSGATSALGYPQSEQRNQGTQSGYQGITKKTTRWNRPIQMGRRRNRTRRAQNCRRSHSAHTRAAAARAQMLPYSFSQFSCRRMSFSPTLGLILAMACCGHGAWVSVFALCVCCSPKLHPASPSTPSLPFPKHQPHPPETPNPTLQTPPPPARSRRESPAPSSRPYSSPESQWGSCPRCACASHSLQRPCFRRW